MKVARHSLLLRGFTLIEMMVVMVILSMTTVLLTEGLGTTWRNFERLGARDLTVSSAQLPVSWFSQSVNGAVLYHPDRAMIEGSNEQLHFYTYKAPTDSSGIIQQIEWRVFRMNQAWALSFKSQLDAQHTTVASFTVPPKFEFLQDGKWRAEFKPEKAQLPRAIRIVNGNSIWAIATVGRPVAAEIPPELAAYGAYEF